ncbi:MAG: sulfite exporter TauE/SafE family protein [Flavobacteriaceae bacterium]|nr:sulfite exporter TauE/SafE family protein [Flavobacteriaceae bacterium]
MINELDFPLLAGTIGAMLHVVSGPDHLVAVAPFAIEEKKKAWKIGLMWGIGHLAGMLAIGVLVLLFKDMIPYEAISRNSEMSVGGILVLLGVWILYKAFYPPKSHGHAHAHSVRDVHSHSHTHPHYHSEKGQGLWTTFLLGTIHGLAGVSHLILFLPVIGFASNFEAGKYLVGFGIGTLFAMTFFAFLVGHFAIFTNADKNEKTFKTLRVISALAAILVGVYWIFENI